MKIVPNGPSKNEILVIRAARRWQRNAVGLAEVTPCGQTPVALSKALHGFIFLLWETDPNAVKVRSVRQEAFTIFELQLLYAISEHKFGSPHKVDELLNWWLPENLLDEGRSRLSDIAVALDDLDLTFDCRPWVQVQLRAGMDERVKGRAPVEVRYRGSTTGIKRWRAAASSDVSACWLRASNLTIC